MNIKQLAQLSGVSPTTVSLVLNGRQCRVSSDTESRIRELAAKHNYQPNQVARNLVTKRSNCFGFISTDLTNPFFATLAGAVEHLLTNLGFSLMLVCSNGTVEDDTKKIDFLCNRGIDGLLFTISAVGNDEYNAEMVKKLNTLTIPFVAVDRWVEGLNCPRVSIDHSHGGFIATDYLLRSGHKRIAILTGPPNNYTAKRRYRGYLQALEMQGIERDESLVFEGDYTFDSGYRLAGKIADSGATAVFASNDMMATGLMRRLGELDIAIPGQMSVMGFDDIFFSEMLACPLTTVRQDLSTLASEVVKMIVERRNDRYKHFDDVKIPTSIIERRSVAKLN